MTSVELTPPAPCASCAVSVTACRAKQANGDRCCADCTHKVELGPTSEDW